MGYFSIKDNDIILSGAENCEFYIPMEYFENDKFASDYGSTISSLGIFITRFYKDGKIIEERTMAIPTWIKLYVYEYTIESVKLPGYDNMMSNIPKVLKLWNPESLKIVIMLLNILSL